MNALSIVDSHVHLWNPVQLDYSWLQGLPTLNRAYLPADFSTENARCGISKWIFVESGCDPVQNMAEVNWIASLAKGEPGLKGIVAQAALEKGRDIRMELTALARQPLVKGVRRILQGEADRNFCLLPAFVDGVGLLAEFGFTFDLCIRADQLPEVVELVRRVPQVQFILDHCGKPGIRGRQTEPWAKNLQALASLPNVSCKISGLTTEADLQNWQPDDLKRYVEWTLNVFGFDRVLFGGDWPVSTLATGYARWLETVNGFVSTASAADRLKLFQTNAERIYHV